MISYLTRLVFKVAESQESSEPQAAEQEVAELYELNYEEHRGGWCADGNIPHDDVVEELEEELKDIGWTDIDLQRLQIASDSTHSEATYWKDIYPE